MFLKTVSGYLRQGEDNETCLKRNLLEKAGISAFGFVRTSRTHGYGDVVKLPVNLYLCPPDLWAVAGKGSCGLVKVSAEEAKKLIDDPLMYDDSSRLLILLFLSGRR